MMTGDKMTTPAVKSKQGNLKLDIITYEENIMTERNFTSFLDILIITSSFDRNPGMFHGTNNDSLHAKDYIRYIR